MWTVSIQVDWDTCYTDDFKPRAVKLDQVELHVKRNISSRTTCKT